MKRIIIGIFVILFAGLSAGLFTACASSAYPMPQEMHQHSLMIDGMERTFWVYDPGVQQNAPVIFMFHGGGGSALGILEDAQWNDLAQRENCIIVYPEGTREHPDQLASFIGNPQNWNDGSPREDVIGAIRRNANDTAFFAAMTEYLKGNYPVDPGRIYAAGFSNGASMVFRLAYEFPDTLAAVAVVAGADWRDPTQIYSANRAVPLLYITGDQDPLNPIDGGKTYLGRLYVGTKLSVAQQIEVWVQRHVQLSGLLPDEYQEENADGVIRRVYTNSQGISLIKYVIITRHGHHWPGGSRVLPARIAGPVAFSCKANEEIWSFFISHHL